MNVFTLSLWENFWWGLIYFDQFIYKIDLPFTRTIACGQRHGLLIAFPNEKYSLKQLYVTSRSGSSISLFVFSDLAVFDKVSTAIRITVDMLNGHVS